MKSILVVDDSPVDRLLIQRLLQRSGEYRVSCVSDGQQALDKIESENPHLVVTDLQMPKLDGLGLVKEVKCRWPNLPIVLVTSQGSEIAAVNALRAGAACYTPKSLLNLDLPRTVEFVLQVSSLTARHTDAPDVRAPDSFQHRFVLDNECKLIGPFIEHLEMRLPSWTADNRLQIAMALGEALVNAMHHGNLEVPSTIRVDDETAYFQMIRQRRAEKPFCERRVRVLTSFDQEEIKIQIEDDGPGFSPNDVPDPREPANLEKLSGRGLMLIRSFMDFVSHSERGNEIVMIRRRCSRGPNPDCSSNQ